MVWGRGYQYCTPILLWGRFSDSSLKSSASCCTTTLACLFAQSCKLPSTSVIARPLLRQLSHGLSTSRLSLPASTNPTQYKGWSPTSPHPTQSGCQARYRLVAIISPILEWESLLPRTEQLSPTTSIQWQELFAIVAVTRTWGDHWSRKRICFYCDNQAIVHAWEGKSSKHPKLMSLMRLLFLTAAQNNFTVKLKHLAGKSNKLADALSIRKLFNRFFLFLFFFLSLAPQANKLTPGILRQL